MLAILRRSMQRLTGPIAAISRLGYSAPKKRRRGGEPLATLRQFDWPGNRTPNLPHRQGRREKFRAPGQKFRLGPLVSGAPKSSDEQKKRS